MQKLDKSTESRDILIYKNHVQEKKIHYRGNTHQNSIFYFLREKDDYFEEKKTFP